MTRPVPPHARTLWQAFAATRPDQDVDARFLELAQFGDDPAMQDELADLVLRGVKRATAGLVWSYEAEGLPIPRPGDLSIVANGAREPLGVIETTQVDVVPFGEVTAAFAVIEGEGDGSLAYWRRVHEAFYERECARIGRTPGPTMPVVCEQFALVFVPAAS